ncbi:hypothetical protein ABKV19_013796 [Rosa sericea]
MLIWCRIPNSNKTDKASMLDEAIEYLKQLQLQVQWEKARNRRRRGRREGQKRQRNPKEEKNCYTSQIQDNLAANFSRELADYIIYIIDVSGGDKIPRKGGPGITQADLLVINKTDLAQVVGADFAVMECDALRMRDGGPFVFAQNNLAANFSRELADYIIYIIDVSGGDKIPRQGGPGITQADLLVCGFQIFSPP